MRRRRILKLRPLRRRGSETVVSTVGPCRIQPSGLGTPHLHRNRNIKAIIPQHHQPNCLPRPMSRAPSEAENPLQPPVTSLSISESATNCPSHRVDNHDEEIVSNNRDSHTPEAAIDHTAQRTEAEDMAVNPLRPNEFFFKPKDYRKSCKLQSRCHQYKFMTILGELDESEKRWFLEHPQFKHLFHMVCTSTRKMMGLWMLLLRTIVTHKSRQAWFSVNGVPIRYSIREHGLISGLYCHQYPENYQSGLSMMFAEKQFRKMFMKKLKNKKKKPEEEELKVTVHDVEEKLSQMKLDRTNDRLKVAILYFLATVIDEKSKYGCPIDPFLLQIVDDLELCNKFSWGRSF
ncbi:PREDICTED: uncharacterized protein At3g43530-like [Brassica oleracea var. oleracea]|uniref:uncharacterized protein At3g43530-like n=1 Tax=Brassica oleracea var. oleracea TaxID=109376 RepID=UPI0006A74B6C|nr:PREDICTED: uncharacterized protein At3g43530-like [Brassica oleracea var. oleracea]